MMKKFYADIFNHSGESYHRAMQLLPNAREEEFNAVLSLLNLKDYNRLLDVPAGGGYLQKYLNSAVDYSGFDFSQSFFKQANISHCSEDNIKVNSNYFDAAVCLAALHHVENKVSFFAELHRCLKPGGMLLIGDVVQGSNEAIFLNGFVNTWNSLGHNGDFLCFERDERLLQETGFSTQTVVKHYYWNFASESDAHDYLRLLFSLDKVPSKKNLNDGVAKLGITETDTKYCMHWSLGFIVATVL